MNSANGTIGLARRIAIGLTALAVAGMARSAKESAGPITIVPDRAVLDETYQVTGNVIDHTQNGLRLRIEPLGPTERDTFLQLRSQQQVVFPRSTSIGFTVFAVSVENGSAEVVTFVPAMASMRDEIGTVMTVLPADWLRETFREMLANDPSPDRAADRVMNAIHAEPLVLQPGQRAMRLLAFGAPLPRCKRLTVELEHITSGKRDISPHFPFLVTRPVAARKAR